MTKKEKREKSSKQKPFRRRDYLTKREKQEKSSKQRPFRRRDYLTEREKQEKSSNCRFISVYDSNWLSNVLGNGHAATGGDGHGSAAAGIWLPYLILFVKIVCPLQLFVTAF